MPHPTRPAFIVAELNYSQPDSASKGAKLYQYINASDVPPGEKRENFLVVPHPFKIHDIRVAADAGEQFGLDICGFQTVKGPTVAIDDAAGQEESRKEWNDDEWVQSVYFREVEELLRNTTRATRVVFFDHTIRKQDNTKSIPDTPNSRQPVSRVHVDQTITSARDRVKRHADPSLVPTLLENRFQIINVWRPLRGPVRDVPLALADWRSVDEGRDLVLSDLRYGEGQPTGETLAVMHNPRHKWWYLSEMMPDDALLIKCFDSKDCVAKLTPHTAFVDEHWKEKVPPRESIEVRALVFY